MIVSVGGYALQTSPDLAIPVSPRDGECYWSVTSTPEVEWPEPDRERPICLREIAGVPLRHTSLVREPVYLDTPEDVRAWIEDQRALSQALQGRREVELVLSHREDRDRRRLSVAVHPGSVIGALPTVGLGALTSLAALLIGAFVFWRRPESGAAWALFALCSGVFCAIIITLVNIARGIALVPWATNFLGAANLLGNLVGTIALVAFALIFPRPLFSVRTRTVILLILVSLGVASFFLELIGVAFTGHALVAILSVVGLVLLVVAQLRPQKPTQRLQARWVLWGLTFPLITWVVIRLPFIVGLGQSEDTTDELLIIACLSIPVGIGVAILRYRLLEIELVIRRTILGALVTTVVLFLYHFLVSAFASSFSGPSEQPPLFFSVFISALVLTFMLLPAQASLERVLDRIFFRNRFHYRKLLRRIPDDLAGLTSLDQAAHHVLKMVGDSMETPKMVVTLSTTGDRPRCWTRGWPDDEEPREKLTPTEPKFWHEVEALSADDLWAPIDSAGDLRRWIDDHGLAMVIPLRTPEALVGLMACSSMPGGKLPTAEDVSLLRSVAASLALALSRSLAYETIRQMNEELEDTIRERTSELEQARLQLYQWEKMASLGVLAAGVAHELNTPLEVVLSASEQLRELHLEQGDSSSRGARLASLCCEGAKRAGVIVRDLRSYSRPESQDIEVVDLETVLESTLTLLGPMVRSRQIELIRQWGDLPPIEVYVPMINQIATNLINNAAQAIDTGEQIHIVTERRGDDRVALIIEDTGPGIPPELRDRIFDPFFSTKPPGEGTGLGLSLCYTMVEQHGGRIWEEGEEGRGARFVVELPITHPPELQERKTRSSMPSL
jgi:signal transduction histidine kinase